MQQGGSENDHRKYAEYILVCLGQSNQGAQEEALEGKHWRIMVLDRIRVS